MLIVAALACRPPYGDSARTRPERSVCTDQELAAHGADCMYGPEVILADGPLVEVFWVSFYPPGLPLFGESELSGDTGFVDVDLVDAGLGVYELSYSPGGGEGLTVVLVDVWTSDGLQHYAFPFVGTE